MAAEILDCTIRDGGYYCDWDFNDNTVRRYLAAASLAGIRHVEIGFRSERSSGFSGKYKFCRDRWVQELFHESSLRVAVMVDGKEFIRPGGQCDLKGVCGLFEPQSKSPVTLVRLATSPAHLTDVIHMGEAVKELGYRVSVNIMMGSMAPESEILRMASLAESSTVDILYLADSFGSLTPSDTRTLFKLVKKNFSRVTGFHGHDNLGLALANTLSAMEEGADIVDSSLLGMGRGAGNLRTEQFLLYLRSKAGRTDVDPSPLFDVALTDFADLHERHRWGINLPYMLSAAYNVHPLYAQRLLQVRRYSPMEVIRVLEAVRASDEGSAFSEDRLSTALKERFSQFGNRMSVDRIPGYRAALPPTDAFKDRSFLLLGSGPSVAERSSDINEFIRLRRPVVIECNVQEGIDASSDPYTLFTNYQRLEKYIHPLIANRRRAVLGMPEISAELAKLMRGMEIYHYPYRISPGVFEVRNDGCVIPHDVVAMFAFAFALRVGAPGIFLCGFDGYVGDLHQNGNADLAERMAMEREMEAFLRLLKTSESVRSGVRVVSLTPTVYDIEQESLYAYL